MVTHLAVWPVSLSLFAVMEYCAAGSLSDIMQICNRTFSEAQVACVMKQALAGLAYLHGPRLSANGVASAPVIHRCVQQSDSEGLSDRPNSSRSREVIACSARLNAHASASRLPSLSLCLCAIRRDIKSGNILVDKNGMSKLADFGVSSNLDKTLGKNRTVIGSGDNTLGQQQQQQQQQQHFSSAGLVVAVAYYLSSSFLCVILARHTGWHRKC